MCTLIAGVEILGPRTLVLGANRDESPDRTSDGPGVLVATPRVIGGRDRVAGGTWLAVREGRSVAALMNRRPTVAPSATIAEPARSRGLLCLEAASSGPAGDAAHAIDPGTGERHPARLHAALALIGRHRYAACTLVGLNVEEPSWAILAEHGAPTRTHTLAPGWHVLTHADVDDPDEPRTAWLLEQLRGFVPRGVEEALDQLGELLRTHASAGEGEGAAGAAPAVCIHRERFPTVSSSLLALGDLGDRGPARYLHAAGPPCVTPYDDASALLG